MYMRDTPPAAINLFEIDSDFLSDNQRLHTFDNCNSSAVRSAVDATHSQPSVPRSIFPAAILSSSLWHPEV